MGGLTTVVNLSGSREGVAESLMEFSLDHTHIQRALAIRSEMESTLHLWGRRVAVLLLPSVFITTSLFSQISEEYIGRQSRLAELQSFRKTAAMASDLTAGQEGFDVTYYKLDLGVSFNPNNLRGAVTMVAKSIVNNLSVIVLDLANAMTVDSVHSGGKRATANQLPSTVSITLDRPYMNGELFTVVVYYHGAPVSTGFGSFNFSSTTTGSRWVWSLSEPYGARDWWPCKDHPGDKADSLDVWITCDSSLKAASEGILTSVTANGDGTNTYQWKHRYPIATYLVSVAIAQYAEVSGWFKYTSQDSMKVIDYPLNASDGTNSIATTIGNLQIYSDLYGLYPFIREKYGHAQFGWGGGMEHQTMVSVVNFSENLIAHEMAHQWFGDMITLQSWPDIWLNEGFATYSVALYRERKYGQSDYWGVMNGAMQSAMSAVGTIHIQDTLSLGTLFNGNLVYQKGATVLHMLRHVLGDSLFFKAVKQYASDSRLRYATASIQDFQRDCELASGKSLSYFFSEWIYGENYPTYHFDWGSAPSGVGYSVRVTLSQTTGTNNPSFFRMPIDFEFVGVGMDTTITAIDSVQNQVFVYNIPKQPTNLFLDKNNWILKNVSSTVVDVNQISETPKKFSLLQNYPNPFNPSTTIRYEVPRSTNATLKIYNTLGQLIATLVNERKEPGFYQVEWNASNVPSGTYFCRMQAAGFVGTKRLIVLK